MCRSRAGSRARSPWVQTSAESRAPSHETMEPGRKRRTSLRAGTVIEEATLDAPRALRPLRPALDPGQRERPRDPAGASRPGPVPPAAALQPARLRRRSGAADGRRDRDHAHPGDHDRSRASSPGSPGLAAHGPAAAPGDPAARSRAALQQQRPSLSGGALRCALVGNPARGARPLHLRPPLSPPLSVDPRLAPDLRRRGAAARDPSQGALRGLFEHGPLRRRLRAVPPCRPAQGRSARRPRHRAWTAS